MTDVFLTLNSKKVLENQRLFVQGNATRYEADYGAQNPALCFAQSSKLPTATCRQLLTHRIIPKQKPAKLRLAGFCFGADYGARTRHLRLGKATLYQMS